MKHCQRPFTSTREMNECMLDHCNKLIGPRDDFYILGDFGFGNFSSIADKIRQLPTKNIFLIRGNHDKLSNQKYIEAGFKWVKDLHEIKPVVNGEKKKIVLCHYPMHSWNGSFHKSWHLHSHTHDTMPDDPQRLRMNVGVDVTDFKPINLADVAKFMSNKKPIFDC